MARSARPADSRRALAAVLAVLVLGAPTAAYPISLAQLLQLPLEQLLLLKITSTRGAAASMVGETHGR